MEREEERLLRPHGTIWGKFAGKRIVLAGADSAQRQLFLQNLAGIRAQLGAGFTVLDGAEHTAEGDYVLLFARPSSADSAEDPLWGSRSADRAPAREALVRGEENRRENLIPSRQEEDDVPAGMESSRREEDDVPAGMEFSRQEEDDVPAETESGRQDKESRRAEAAKNPAKGKRRRMSDSWSEPWPQNEGHSWEKAPDAWKRAGDAWEETLGVLSQLRAVGRARPESVLVLSGNEVYGKIFGEPHAVSEEELGYVSHTDSSDSAAQCLRTVEAFARQTVREEHFPVKLARIGELPEGDGMWMLLENCMRVLLCGADGEVYNVPGGREAGRAAYNLPGGSGADGTAYNVPGGPGSGRAAYPVPDAPDTGQSPLSPVRIVADTRKFELLGE